MKRDNANDHDHDLANELILKNGRADMAMTIGPGMILGGVALTQKDVGKIRDFIDSNSSMTFVLFVPLKDSTFIGHVAYDIKLTDSEPIAGKMPLVPAVVKVGVGANPSPPRNS